MTTFAAAYKQEIITTISDNTIRVNKVDYYLIAPFHILNKCKFKACIRNALKNETLEINTRKKESLKEHLTAFLGLNFTNEKSIISHGFAYKTNFQNNNDSLLKTFKSDIRVVKNNDKEFNISNPIVQPEQTMELYISPNQTCGIAVLPLSGKQETLSEVVKMNYILHKTDKNQIPIIKRRTSYDKATNTTTWSNLQSTDKFGKIINGTLIDVFEHAIPVPNNYFEWENTNRLIMATYFSIDTSNHPDEELIRQNVVCVGQTKDDSYQFAWNTMDKVTELYANIMAYATPEGFACCVLNDQGKEAGDFLRNFGDDSFRMSYLPIFLSSIMADLIITNAIRNVTKVATRPKELNMIREAQLAVTLAPSHYEHLIRLMTICRHGRMFDQKSANISDHINARKVQMETNTNYILGFIGIGQVVFAILQFTGVNNVFGEKAAESTFAIWATHLSIAVFAAAILFYIIKRILDKKGH